MGGGLRFDGRWGEQPASGSDIETRLTTDTRLDPAGPSATTTPIQAAARLRSVPGNAADEHCRSLCFTTNYPSSPNTRRCASSRRSTRRIPQLPTHTRTRTCPTRPWPGRSGRPGRPSAIILSRVPTSISIGIPTARRSSLCPTHPDATAQSSYPAGGYGCAGDAARGSKDDVDAGVVYDAGPDCRFGRTATGFHYAAGQLLVVGTGVRANDQRQQFLS